MQEVQEMFSDLLVLRTRKHGPQSGGVLVVGVRVARGPLSVARHTQVRQTIDK